jgi:uncharacterized membrane protein YheB (UPF0754 family)
MDEDELNELVREVAKQRQTAQMYKRLVDEMQELLEKTPAWKDLQQLQGKAKTQQAELNDWEERLDKAALDQFRETVEKHPHPAVQIKMHTRLDYSREHAKEYCIQHLPNALKLDTTVFEKAARVLGLDWVSEGLFPRAYVDRDLSAYLDLALPEGDQ